MKRTPSTLLLIAAFSTLAGCASVPMGDAQQDAALKTFVVPKGKSGLYIYRNESIGGAITMDVAVNGNPIGQTGAKTFLYKELAPGKYTITSKAENTDKLVVDAKPGRAYFVWQRFFTEQATGKRPLPMPCTVVFPRDSICLRPERSEAGNT